ncbi:MAG: hypothetical protein ACOVSW_19530, partial [Candidatus Kapaibacteriota bacterium]
MCHSPSIVNVSFQRKYLIFLVTLYSFAFAQSGYGQVVSTLAGDGTAGFLDGTGVGARFNQPFGICADGAGNLFVADYVNNRIRRIAIATGVVTTLAGDGTYGFADGIGTAARFASPTDVTSDGLGNLYVVDMNNYKIRKIVIATGAVTTLAGSTFGFANGIGSAAQFANPIGIATDGAGNLYVCDRSNVCIRKIVIATGDVSTLVGSTMIGDPYDLVSDGLGNLYVVDSDNSRIRKIEISTGIVTTLAGDGISGFMDGIGTSARFSFPRSISYDGVGNLYIV